jgi:hypothetical protein
MTFMESTDPKDFPLFGELDESTYAEKESELLGLLERCCTIVGLSYANMKYSKTRLREIIKMVERRRVYFHVFHRGEGGRSMEMGELNEACLQCFWILKLFPFFDAEDPDNNVNLVFSLKLFIDTIWYVAATRTPPQKANCHSDEVLDHLLHAFRVRDLSKEAMMAIAVSMIIA